MASGTSSFSTCYSQLSGVELNGLFTTDTWNSLSTDQRLAACQEVENRYAAETGHPPIQVSAVSMVGSLQDGYTWGYQQGNHLYLNLDVLESGQFRLSDQDEKGNNIITTINAPAPNWNMLDTVFHEGTHGFQYQEGRQGYTYIQFETDADLYRIQPIEAEAFREGNTRTVQAILQQMELTGKVDANAQAYLNSVKADSYQAALQEAARNYNDPHIDQTLAQFIYDRNHNIQPKEPSASYQAISKAYDQAMGKQLDKSETDRTGPVSPPPGRESAPPNGGQKNEGDRQDNGGQKNDDSRQNDGDRHNDGDRQDDGGQKNDDSRQNDGDRHNDGDRQDDGGQKNDDGRQDDGSQRDDGGQKNDDGQQNDGSQQDDGGQQNDGSQQDDGGQQNDGSQQDDGSQQNDDGGQQDDGSSYQGDGSSYQGDGGSYQEDGGGYQDDGGYQGDGGSYQEDGGSYQEDGGSGGYDSGSDSGGSDGGSDRDGGMDND